MKSSSRLKVAEDLTGAIGNTPIIKMKKIAKAFKVPDLELFGKAEFMNPSGSLKDRILFKILSSAIEKGQLKRGMTIIESTTGNTGIATSMMGALFGFPVVIVMPAGMSEERKKTMRIFGAEIVEVPGAESDVDLALNKVKELIKRNPKKYFFVNQFNNPENVQAHYETTAPEIWEQLHGRLDAFVATAGTGGTITGVGRYLKEKNPKIKIYLVEPSECPVLSKQRWGTHQIEGIGDGFIPSIMDISILDGVILVDSKTAIEMTRRLAREEGLFVGISSGANVKACLELHKRHPELKRIVTMLNDHGYRYFSTAVFGKVKKVEIPERPHPIEITPEQIKILSRLEIIE
ncbi:MAG: cysteine synthase A [Candidatus Hadarchaeum sp.]|uniref:cysteine synthase A n=1 Tax=Candidatus Hadarchaeum sp. TaxID=2883567 RepID=UPI003D09C43B